MIHPVPVLPPPARLHTPGNRSYLLHISILVAVHHTRLPDPRVFTVLPPYQTNSFSLPHMVSLDLLQDLSHITARLDQDRDSTSWQQIYRRHLVPVCGEVVLVFYLADEELVTHCQLFWQCCCWVGRGNYCEVTETCCLAVCNIRCIMVAQHGDMDCHFRCDIYCCTRRILLPGYWNVEIL